MNSSSRLSLSLDCCTLFLVLCNLFSADSAFSQKVIPLCQCYLSNYLLGLVDMRRVIRVGAMGLDRAWSICEWCKSAMNFPAHICRVKTFSKFTLCAFVCDKKIFICSCWILCELISCWNVKRSQAISLVRHYVSYFRLSISSITFPFVSVSSHYRSPSSPCFT